MANSLPFQPPRRGKASPAQAGQDVTGQFVPAPATLSVSGLVSRIKEALLDGLPQRQAVVGEISNFKLQSSGHMYFCLKDAQSSIDAVMFRPDAKVLRFEPQDGLEVVAEGRVDVYERSGRLQFYVSRLTPKGAGALELAFRQLKDKLQAEGLFAPEHKVHLPRFPRGIGVVTSPTGAALRDIYRTLCRRWPAAGVYLLPVRVQGEGSAEEVAAAIASLDRNAQRLGIDTIILGRGGGSLEDLWAFNEEVVARAVYACQTPLVCGVGHETDFTIADFVADVRAATPTAAAELATPDRAELHRMTQALGSRLHRRMRDSLAGAGQALKSVQRSSAFRHPRLAVQHAQQRLDELATRLRSRMDARCHGGEQRLHEAQRALISLHPQRLAERARAKLASLQHNLAWVLGHRAKLAGDELARLSGELAAAGPQHRLGVAKAHLEGLGGQLEALSYRSALRRGYSVTRGKTGQIIRSIGHVHAGSPLETEVADGKIGSIVGPPGQRPARRKTVAGREPGPSLFDNTEEQP